MKKEKTFERELRYCQILKTNINVTDMGKTVAYITKHLEKLRGNYICVSNVHTTVMAYRDKNYRKIQNSAAMALPDGQPLSIVSRARGYKDAKRVPGPDLMPEIFRLSRERGYTHYFYGGSETTLEALRNSLQRDFPYLQIVGMYSPPYREMTPEEDERIIEQINAAKPDFVWVALGAPKQEIWMYRHRKKINGLMIGVGAAFDFLGGTVKRAPMWMQKLCLEWVYRIFQDPKRMIPRYLNTNFAFLYHTYREGRALAKEKKAGRTPNGGKRLRIAMIGHKRIPSREGGVEIIVEQLSVRLAALGHQVDAYNRYGHHVSGKKYDEEYGRGDRKYYKKVRIRIVPTFRSSKLNAIVYSFLATIRAVFRPYDVMHYHAEGPCAVLWIPKLLGKRIVVTVHGLDWQRAKWGNFASGVIKFGEKMAVKYADEIIVLSKNVQQYFRDTYGRETTFIPNAVEKPERKPAELITEKYGLKEDGYFLYLARIVPEKGVHYLIEAFREIDTDKKLVIAGGNSQAVEYMDMVHAMAAKDKRIIMTDFVQGQALEELYSNAYAFILPSDVEGMSVGLLEAMSYGRCCLVSDICENTEVVEDKALTFVKSDVRDLRAKLEYLLQHPEVVEEYKRLSSDFICRKYNWEDIIQETLAVYKKVRR
ncbi:MAG: WecB/TagA/CpsF family glycosyltransferase [Muribaculaceae bacterium]|nr:WecB/TagA/CpsF family glycosyltransferase [Muribaculaceae bacterium]